MVLVLSLDWVMCFPQEMLLCMPALALVRVLQVVGYPKVDFSYILTAVLIVIFPKWLVFSICNNLFNSISHFSFLKKSTFCIYPFLLSLLISKMQIVLDRQTLWILHTHIVNSICCMFFSSKDIMNEELRKVSMASCKFCLHHFLGNTGGNNGCP